jgi:tripeptide aminopeptidase
VSKRARESKNTRTFGLTRNRRAAAVAAMLLLAAAPEAWSASADEPSGRLERLTADPRVIAALADVELRMGRFVDEWIRIAEIPAPSGGEERRAEYLERRFRELGLVDVARDAAGNVVGLKEGRRRGAPRGAFIAHMDTVARATADHTVRRSGTDRLEAPGIRDDSSGLAALVSALELMRDHGLRPAADTWFVASASEEVGLKGAAAFVEERFRDLGAVVAVDGSLGQISYGATGIAWLKLVFTGEGAHTLRAWQKSSAIAAVARAIERVNALDVRRSPPDMESWLSVGMIGGGEVPNALPQEAWFVTDIRSNDPPTFEAMQLKVIEAGERTAREMGVELRVETLHRMPGARLPGFERSLLVSTARAVLDRLGWTALDLTPRGTADHNAALARGIPGIAIGVTTGDGAHTAGEFAEIAPFAIGVKQVLLLALLPLTPES